MRETPDAVSLVFDVPPTDPRFAYRAGQFLTLLGQKLGLRDSSWRCWDNSRRCFGREGAKLPAARVCFAVSLPNVLVRQVGIHFSRRDIGMAKHCLNHTKIGPSFEQVRGKTVSQLVRANRAHNANAASVLADDFPETLAGHCLAPG